MNKAIDEFLDRHQIKYFVISAGKTGSMTIEFSVNGAFRVHRDLNLWKRFPELKAKNVLVSDLVRRLGARTDKKPLILSSVREPISRAISEFLYSNLHLDPEHNPNPDLNQDLNTLIRKFTRKHLTGTWNDYHPFFCNPTIIPTLADQDRDHIYLETAEFRILLLDFEHIDQWNQIIPKYLDNPGDFNWRPYNLTHQHEYRPIADKFKAHITLPRDLVEAVYRYHQPYLRYFQTQTKIDLNKRKWLDKSQAEILPTGFDWLDYANKQRLTKTSELSTIHHWLNHQ